MSKKRGFRVFQTHGWIPGTKISYYAERPLSEVGVEIVPQKKTNKRRKRG